MAASHPDQPQPTYPVTLPREYPPAPLVGVAAAVFHPDGRVLLVQRGRPPDQGLWGLPGGLLKLGERLADGARREVLEECGVVIQVGEVAGVFEPILRDEEGRVRYHYVVVDFWASYVSGEPRAQDDAAALAWVPVAELGRYPMREESRQVVRRAYALWRQERGADEGVSG